MVIRRTQLVFQQQGFLNVIFFEILHIHSHNLLYADLFI